MTPNESFVQAAILGDLDRVRNMVDYEKMDVNTPNEDGWTCLHHVCSSTIRPQSEPLVQFLIERGANVNARSSCGETPLHFCCQDDDNINIVRLLVQAGCDIHANVNRLKLEKQVTALDVAVEARATKIVIYLLEHGAQIRNTQAILKHATADFSGELVRKLNADDRVNMDEELMFEELRVGSLLHLATMHGNVEVVRFLLQQTTADVNVRNWRGQTPLILSVKHGNTRLVRCLIDEGADVDAKDAYGKNALACHHLQMEVLKIVVLEGKANVNSKDHHGWTFLHWLCNTQMNDECALHKIRFIVEHGATVNAKAQSGQTPLHLLCRQGAVDEVRQLEIIDFLVNNGANVNEADSKGETPLHYICSNFQWFQQPFQYVKYFVEHGAFVQANAHDGRTPLHAICHQYENLSLLPQQLDTVEFLLFHGANMHALDKSGLTPMFLAGRNNGIHVIRLLVEIYFTLPFESEAK